VLEGKHKINNTRIGAWQIGNGMHFNLKCSRTSRQNQHATIPQGIYFGNRWAFISVFG